MTTRSASQSNSSSSLFDISSVRTRVQQLESELRELQQVMQLKEKFLEDLENRIGVCEQLAGIGVDYTSGDSAYDLYYGGSAGFVDPYSTRSRVYSGDTKDTDSMQQQSVGSNSGRILGYKHTFNSDVSVDNESIISNGGSSPNKKRKSAIDGSCDDFDNQCKRKSEPKFCTFEGCHKMAHGPTYLFCLRHGGGYRCQEPGCTRSAYSTKYCSRHGGGPRCQWDGCVKGAISNSSYCRRHGGGNRCQHPNCPEGARQGFNFCLNHGGFNPCAFPNCPGIALLTSNYCRQHNAIAKLEATTGPGGPVAVAALMDFPVKKE